MLLLEAEVLLQGEIPVVVSSGDRLAPNVGQGGYGSGRRHCGGSWMWESNVEGISRGGRIGCCPGHRVGGVAR